MTKKLKKKKSHKLNRKNFTIPMYSLIFLVWMLTELSGFKILLAIASLVGIAIFKEMWETNDTTFNPGWQVLDIDMILLLLAIVVINVVYLFIIAPSYIVECDNIEKMNLPESLQDARFDDDTYYELSCEGQTYYIDDDYQINPDGVYNNNMFSFLNEKGPKTASNYQLMKENTSN